MSLQSGPYQSQVLSFLNRQKLRWGDRLKTGLRQLQQTAIWSAQIALYPIYLIFQSARMVTAQMGQATAYVMPRLKAAVRESAMPAGHNQSPEPTIWPDQLTSDTPLRQILLTVQSYGLPLGLPVAEPPPVVKSAQLPTIPLSFRSWVRLADWLQLALVKHNVEPATSSEICVLQPKQTNALVLLGQGVVSVAARSLRVVSLLIQQSSRYVAPVEEGWPVEETGRDWIRGVASWLDTRSLVLVTHQNQILDVLTPDQQTRLRQRIIWEVAHLARYQKLRIDTRLAVTRLKLETTRPYLLPPVRWFYRLMAWVQTSPLAIATNLFQEATFPGRVKSLPAFGLTTSGVRDAVSPGPFILPPADALKPDLLSTGEPALLRPLTQMEGIAQLTIQRPSWQTQWLRTVQSVTDLFQSEASITRQATAALESSAALQPWSQSTSSAHTHVPDYIEAKVTGVSYERSLLFRILQWVDQGLVWLEAQWLKIWSYIQNWLVERRAKP